MVPRLDSASWAACGGPTSTGRHQPRRGDGDQVGDVRSLQAEQPTGPLTRDRVRSREVMAGARNATSTNRPTRSDTPPRPAGSSHFDVEADPQQPVLDLPDGARLDRPL